MMCPSAAAMLRVVCVCACAGLAWAPATLPAHPPRARKIRRGTRRRDGRRTGLGLAQLAGVSGRAQDFPGVGSEALDDSWWR